MKRMGPSIDPCGTAHLTLRYFESIPFTVTNCFPLLKDD